MSFIIKEVKDKKIWENFILKLPFFTFLQSWDWGEVEKGIKRKTFRWGIFENEKLIGVALVLKIRTKFGTFGYCPHGPLFSEEENFKEKLKFLFDFLEEWAKKENLIFIRFGTIFDLDKEKILKSLKLIKAPTHIYTDNFLILDLDKDEEELLFNMRKTTRNLIKRAEKEGVVIKKSKDINSLKTFYNLLKKTAKRQHFVPYSFDFLKEEFEVFSKRDNISFFEGFYKNQVLSSAMIVFYGNSAFYHHGASIPTKVPVSYLLQWEVIKEAKRQGKKYYNFWGFAKDNNPNHPFYGITIFKKGFGGKEVICCPNYDLVIKKSYFINYIIDLIRKIKRGH